MMSKSDNFTSSMVSSDLKLFKLTFDSNQDIITLFFVGCVTSYISIIFNVIVFIVLFHKNIISPTTVLMQGFMWT